MSCEVCQEESAKYKCPRCGLKTCCVKCVRQHKEEKSCNGLRDKTAFVPVSKFTDQNLRSDYHFLEDVARKRDTAERQSRQYERQEKSKFLNKLVNQARRRHVDLHVLPYTFQKRKSNSTVYWKKSEQIMWQMEWIFPHAGAKYTNKRVAEDTSLEDVLKQYLHPTESDPVIRHRLKEYVNLGMEKCALCLKVEGEQAKEQRYHKLDLKETIANNLRGKRIVEFPSIEVVLPKHLPEYKLQSESVSQSGTG